MWKFYAMDIDSDTFKVGISELKPNRHLQDRASELRDRLELSSTPRKLDSFNIAKDRTTAEMVETQVIDSLQAMGFQMVKSDKDSRTERFYKMDGVEVVEVTITIRKSKTIQLKVGGATVEWAKDEKRVPRVKKQ